MPMPKWTLMPTAVKQYVDPQPTGGQHKKLKEHICKDTCLAIYQLGNKHQLGVMPALSELVLFYGRNRQTDRPDHGHSQAAPGLK